MFRPLASFSAGRWRRLPQSGPAGSTGVRVVSLGPTRRSKKHNFLWNYCRGVGLVLEATLDAKHKACRISTSTRPSQDGPRKKWSRRTLSNSRGNLGGRHSPERQPNERSNFREANWGRSAPGRSRVRVSWTESYTNSRTCFQLATMGSPTNERRSRRARYLRPSSIFW